MHIIHKTLAVLGSATLAGGVLMPLLPATDAEDSANVARSVIVLPCHPSWINPPPFVCDVYFDTQGRSTESSPKAVAVLHRDIEVPQFPPPYNPFPFPEDDVAVHLA